MSDASVQRKNMVESQVRPSDVTDRRIIAAMLTTPREQFLPPEKAPVAYMDTGISLTGGRAMLAPRTLAKLLQLAELKDGDHVLVVGALGGYTAALLATIAKSVVALENDAALSVPAQKPAPNVVTVSGPLSEGWSASAPYDVIFIEGAVETVPEPLIAQLKEGGRMVAIVKEPGTTSRAVLWHKTAHGLAERPDFDAAAPVLPGFTKPRAFAL